MRFWDITRKDLRLLFRDRRALTVLVALPLIFITIIGLTTGRLLGWQNSNQVLTIAAVDRLDYDAMAEEDRTPARNLVTKIFNGLQEEKGINILEVKTEEEAMHLCEVDTAVAALVIDPDFYERTLALRPTDIFHPDTGTLGEGVKSIGVRLDSQRTDASTHSIIENLVFSSTLKAVVPVITCANSFLERMTRSKCEQLAAEAEQPPIERMLPDPNEVMNDELIYQKLIPSYTVMFVFFLVNIMARSFIHERDLGTLRRLRIAPLSTSAVLTGKTLPFLFISLVQTATLFLCGKALFGMNWGTEPLWLLLVIFCTSLAATALGLLLSTVVRTEGQVSAYANTVVITMAGVSGCFMPREWLPDAMKTLSLATPHAWALMAYDEILNQSIPNLPLVLQSCGWMAAFAALYFALGSWRFTRAM